MILHRIKYCALIVASMAALAAMALCGAGVASAASFVGSGTAPASRATASGSPVPALVASYSTIDFPGAVSTVVTGIIRTGPLGRSLQVVGWYLDATGTVDHGFVLSRGRYTTLDFPGADTTLPWAVNSRGEMVGTYSHDNWSGLCSFHYASGNFTTLYPATCPSSLHQPMYSSQGINDSGTVVGNYLLGVKRYGFLIANGTLQTVTYPGSSDISLTGINNNPSPEMVGFYFDSQLHAHGLVFHGSHTAGTSFDVPGAYSTSPFKVNDSGQIAGQYDSTDPTYAVHGFVYDGTGYTRIDYPGAHNTSVFALDNRSAMDGSYDIGGYYQTGNGSQHGFIATSTIGGAVGSP